METTRRRQKKEEEEEDNDKKDEKKRYRLRLQAVRQQDFPPTYAQLRRRWWHDQKSTSQPLVSCIRTTKLEANGARRRPRVPLLAINYFPWEADGLVGRDRNNSVCDRC